MRNRVAAAGILPALSLTLLLGACGGSPGGDPPSPAADPAADGGLRAPASLAPASDRWFVELEGDPAALSAQSVGGQQATFRAQAVASGVQYQEVASYHRLFNGFSVRAGPAEVGRLSRLSGVANVYPVTRIELPRTTGPAPLRGLNALQPDVLSAQVMTGVDLAQGQWGLTGRGVRVGVIDSGIDLDHPAFRGRVNAGYDFVGDGYDASGAQGSAVPVPDDTPDDCAGHGTQVAGILGGSDPASGFQGAAPGVSFGAYKIFGCRGSADSDVLLAALERAQADGMQVVNLSVGVPFQWPQYPTARAASRLVKRGVVVVAAAGDHGQDGPYAVSAPALGENVLAVASVDNTTLQLGNFTLRSDTLLLDGSVAGYLPVVGAPGAPGGLSLPVAKGRASTPTTDNDGCSIDGLNPYAPGSLNGRAALIRLGNCAPREKALNAVRAGASAVIFYNDQPGFANVSVAPTGGFAAEPLERPAVLVRAADGQKLDALIAGGVTVTFNAGTRPFDNPTGNAVSEFSSLGMSPDLELKPELAAPGGSVRTTVALGADPGGFAVLSGTSLAAPHVTGIAALLLEAEPGLPAQALRTRLINSAQIRWFLEGGASLPGVPAYVQRQGAGLVNVIAAAAGPVAATPSTLSLGASQTFGVRSKVVVLRNGGPKTETFKVSHVPARTLGGSTLEPRPNSAAARLSVGGQDLGGGAVTVTVPAGSEAELNVLVTPPAGPAAGQYGGYLALDSVDSANGHHLVIPYSGFVGDYQALKVLGDVSFDGGRAFRKFPALYDPKTFKYYPDGSSPATPPAYTLKEVQVFDDSGKQITVLDAPQVLVHFAHQARQVTLELLDAGGNTLGTVFRQGYVGRSATNLYASAGSDAFSFLGWDGTLGGGQPAPAGTYQLRARVLKALGDPANPAHTETYTSPGFQIVR